MQNVISFPGLGIDLTVQKIAFSLFGLSVHWYGIIIALGFLLAVWYCYKRSPRFGMVGDDLIDLLIFAVPISIVGARIYYVIFNYDKLYYYDHAAMFRIWDGGIAIYGAIIFAVITALIFAKIKKIRIGTLLDVGALGLLIGQAVGRWGNFVNQEAHGSETTLPWRMEIYEAGARITVHPTFLYESLWNALGFLLLHFYSKKRKYTGEIFLLYTAWYGFGRGFIEGMRTDSLYFFDTGLRVSQFFGFFTCILAVGILIYMYLFKEKNPDALANAYLAPRKTAGGAAPAATDGVLTEESEADINSGFEDEESTVDDTESDSSEDDGSESGEDDGSESGGDDGNNA